MATRRYDPEPPTFAQTVVMVVEALTLYPSSRTSDAELTERTIERLRHWGFQYDKATIHKAIDALTRNPINRRSDRST